jgi:NADH dehydrogenase
MADHRDRLITLFGAGGFIGRYVSQQLLKTGVRLRAAEREPRKAWFLKPLGAVGQVQLVSADIRDADSAARAIDGADTVINLVGILKGAFEAFHVRGAANVAQAAARQGCSALVHISAIGADPESPSDYGRSKGLGEEAVRAAFPNATIVRPSIVFGPEDDFISRFASMGRQLPVLPVMAPGARFQPVYVADLARAIAAAALEPEKYAGRTFELGGPQVVTMAELNAGICRLTGRAGKPVAVIPDAVGGLMAKLTGWLPGAPITMDQWRMLQVPNVVGEGAEGFEAFGIRPQPFEAVAANWLTPYRKGGRFGRETSPY